MKPPVPDPGPDRLMQVLDEWQPTPELSPDFGLRLRRRILAAPAPLPWWSVIRLQWVAVAVLLVLIAGVGWYAHLRDTPAAAPATSAVIEAEMIAQPGPDSQAGAQLDPVMRDLQMLNRDGDLIEHLDFLSAGTGTTRIQDRVQND